MKRYETTIALLPIALCAVGVPANAQDAPDADVAAEGPSDIIVTAPRLRGSVEGDIPPDLILDGTAIDSYGASNVTDLLAALSTQTRTGRGRGGGQPVVLVNGKRVSGFAEIRDLPSEAIQRVEILPEDVALRYGATADQRVINFILRENFAAVTGEIEYARPTQGGRDELEIQSTYTHNAKSGRLNLSAQYDRDGSVLESERNIVSSGADVAPFRTLLPKNEALNVNGNFNRTVFGDVSATANVRHDRADTEALLGLPLTGLDPLERAVRTRTIAAGFSLDGRLGPLNWSATGSYDRTTVRTLTDSAAGGARDAARSGFLTHGAAYSLTGPLVRLPAGAVTVNVRAGFDRRQFESLSVINGSADSGRLRRWDANSRANIDIPLASRSRGIAAALGDLSINLNGGFHRLSDFGVIAALGYGLNWTPTAGVNLLASFVNEETAPTPQQLGNPLLVSPGVVVFDFVRGSSAVVSQISGGNDALISEKRRDVKLGLSYSPPKLSGFTISANYFRNRATNPIANFPALTDAAEAAFPGRIARDASGQLVSVDLRPINFLASSSDQLRWGISFAREFGQTQQGAKAEDTAPQGRMGGRLGGFGRFLGGGQGGRWSLSLFHTVKFRDRILPAAGQPALDLIGGDATNQNSGSPQHLIDLEGGWFFRGIGIRMTGAYQSATVINGSGIAPDLRFGTLAVFGLRAFLNFDQQPKLIARAGFLKGARLSLRVSNLTDTYRRVRDENGVVPLSYQRGFIDPLGRTLEISFRKLF